MERMDQKVRQLVFENGRVFRGVGFGADVDIVSEAVFDTSMVGYQEIMSDPSYCGQMVAMTYPIIGSYGLTDEDYESRAPSIGGLVVREYNDNPSNYRFTKTLAEEMEESGIPGIEGVDTREITRMLRDEGAMRAVLCDASIKKEDAIARIKNTPEGPNPVASVSCKKLWYSRTANYEYNIVAVDCGIKSSMIQSLKARGCNVIVVPYDTPAERVRSLKPDGLFLSSGPGNPEDAQPVVKLVKTLQGELPIFGTCLGHQLIALANGARVKRLKAGHHGGNHPVKNLATGKIEITAQNHIYVVDGDSVAGTGLEVTHLNLLDGTVEGLSKKEDAVFSVQFHPESAPGAADSAYLFDEFIAMIDRFFEGRAR